ncbi:MAG: hypothetical protein JNK05_24040 [Myxococcales bacterium]|nr:hypothetical protein [Myxococcales bacterium]
MNEFRSASVTGDGVSVFGVLVYRQYGHGFRESTPVEDAGDPGRIDPGAIAIGAAVNMVFAIEPIDA